MKYVLGPAVRLSGVANMSAFQSEAEEYCDLTHKAAYDISLLPSSVKWALHTTSHTMEGYLSRLDKEIQYEDRALSRLFSWIFPPALSTVQILSAIENFHHLIDRRLSIQIDEVKARINDTDRIIARHAHLSSHSLDKMVELKQLSHDDRSVVERWWQRDVEKERA